MDEPIHSEAAILNTALELPAAERATYYGQGAAREGITPGA